MKEANKADARVQKAKSYVRKDQTGEDLCSSLFAAQVRTLWMMNVPPSTICEKLDLHENKLYAIAEAYNFPPVVAKDGKSEAVRMPPKELLNEFRELWLAGLTHAEITDKIGWPSSKINEWRHKLDLPSKEQVRQSLREKKAQELTNDDLLDMTFDAVMKGDHTNKHPVVEEFDRQYTLQNLEILRQQEFDTQMRQTDKLQMMAWELLKVMGKSAGEISAFSDEESLLKKSSILQKTASVIHQNLTSRREMTRLDKPLADEQVTAGMWNFDYVAAARRGGLETGEELIIDHADSPRGGEQFNDESGR